MNSMHDCVNELGWILDIPGEQERLQAWLPLPSFRPHSFRELRNTTPKHKRRKRTSLQQYRISLDLKLEPT